MQKLYLVTLTEEQVQILEDILHKGKHTAQKRNRAQALLLADEGWTDAKIADATHLTTQAVELLRKRFVKEGFEPTLKGKPGTPRRYTLDGRAEAHLSASRLAAGIDVFVCARRT